MYKAMDIALYCVYFCSQKLKRHISNLELQKILYYIQGAFLAQEGQPCFAEPIVAWRYGPVVEEVYYELRRFGSNSMGLSTEPSGIAKKDKEIIEQICSVKADVGALKLANQTHEETPWMETTQSAEINIDKIQKYFSSHPDRLM